MIFPEIKPQIERVTKPLRLDDGQERLTSGRFDIRETMTRYGKAIRREFAGRRPVVIQIIEQPMVMKHQKLPDGLDCRTGCPACELEKREAEGRPVISYLVEIERNSLTEFTLRPKRSRRARQAKKFRTMGVMTEQPVRLTEIWRMSRLQLQLLREEWVGLRYAHRQREVIRA